MKIYYVEFDVYEDYFRYSGYVEAESKEEAIRRIKTEEGDVKEIIECKEVDQIGY